MTAGRAPRLLAHRLLAHRLLAHRLLAHRLLERDPDRARQGVHRCAGDGIEIPMDFSPEEAEEIAEEIRLAATAARKVKPKSKR